VKGLWIGATLRYVLADTATRCRGERMGGKAKPSVPCAAHYPARSGAGHGTVVCNFDPADKNGSNATRRPVRIQISAHILDP